MENRNCVDCSNHGIRIEVIKLQRENEILKQIILDELNVVGEFCSLCQKKGQYLPTCDCMENKECLENLIKLYGEKK